MNLNQLRYVKAVADSGSFTLAAEQCYVTQPTLSNGIAQFENELGEKIFTRTTRIVSLTPFGQHILPYIVKILDTQAELLHQSRQFNQPNDKVIRIGVSPIMNSQWLIPIIEDYRKQHTDSEIILYEQNMIDLYRMLDDKLLDFVFGVEDINKSTWQTLRLYQEPLYFIPRAGKQDDKLETIEFSKITDETFVMVPNVCGLATTTRALFRKYRKKLKEYSGEAFSYQVLEEWASLGLGAAILPKSKLQVTKNNAYALQDKKSNAILISMVAYWANHRQPEFINDFVQYLQSYHQ